MVLLGDGLVPFGPFQSTPQRMQTDLFNEWKHAEQPTSRLGFSKAPAGISDPAITPATRRKERMATLVIQRRQRKLLETVTALRPPRRLAGSLHGGEQQCHQHCDDRNHDQQLDERKRMASLHVSSRG